MDSLVCLHIFTSELKIIQEEVTKLRRLRKVSLLVGLPLVALGLISFFFPGQLFKIDDVSKLFTVVSGGIFFSTINFFNKGDYLSLRKRIVDLKVFISEYDNFEAKSELEKQQLAAECAEIMHIKKQK